MHLRIENCELNSRTADENKIAVCSAVKFRVLLLIRARIVRRVRFQIANENGNYLNARQSVCLCPSHRQFFARSANSSSFRKLISAEKKRTSSRRRSQLVARPFLSLARSVMNVFVSAPRRKKEETLLKKKKDRRREIESCGRFM